MKPIQKTLLIISVFLISTLSLAAQQQWLEILKTDNSTKNVELTQLNKLTFSNTDLILNYFLGGEEAIPRQEIRKIAFGNATGVQNVLQRNSFRVYPNPAAEFIRLTNIPDAQYTVTIFSITGNQITTLQNFTIQQSIDISNIQKGMYIIRANNFVTKFTKE